MAFVAVCRRAGRALTHGGSLRAWVRDPAPIASRALHASSRVASSDDDESSSSKGDDDGASTSTPKPKIDLADIELLTSQFRHADAGGAVGSGVGSAAADAAEDDAAEGGGPSREKAEPKVRIERILKHRMFFPGQRYETDDLAPRDASDGPMFTEGLLAKRGTFVKPPNLKDERSTKILTECLDFRDVKVLSNFVTDTGRIIPRRKTGVRQKVQRKMNRAIKTARQMAIMPFDERLVPIRRRT
jgi:small subunit ribosomal protein S18|tara:strand:+ start:543 stop:1274 length:732 start_codon:yes stop_codon:yes gene_type:complete